MDHPLTGRIVTYACYRAYGTAIYAELVEELGDPYLDPIPLPVRRKNQCFVADDGAVEGEPDGLVAALPDHHRRGDVDPGDQGSLTDP